MGVRRYQDLIAWQMAQAFTDEIIGLLKGNPRAAGERRYAAQLLSAAQSVPANIAEGFLRKSPGDFRRFIRIGLGSLGEAEGRLADGIRLGYFTHAECEPAFRFARRCAVAATRLADAQLSFLRRRAPGSASPARDSPPQAPAEPENRDAPDPEDPST